MQRFFAEIGYRNAQNWRRPWFEISEGACMADGGSFVSTSRARIIAYRGLSDREGSQFDVP